MTERNTEIKKYIKNGNTEYINTYNNFKQHINKYIAIEHQN